VPQLEKHLVNRHLTIAFLVLLPCMTTGGARAAIRYQLTDLGSFEGESYATAISSGGQYVAGAVYIGASSPLEASFERRAFLYSGAAGMQDLGTLGGTSSSAFAVNIGGRVAGSSQPADGAAGTAFLYTPGIGMQNLGALGGTESSAYGINDSAQVVGWASTAEGSLHAFLYKGSGPLIDLGTLGGSDSVASGINTAGVVVGTAQVSDGTYHAFLYNETGMYDLGSLGVDSYADAVNDRGQVVGRFKAYDGSEHGFLYSDGTMQDLGATFFWDNVDINNSGQIVGGSYAAFLRNPDGSVTNLNDAIDPAAGWYLQRATAISDTGRIVGYGTAPDGQTCAFLLDPVPEPPTLALLTAGAAALVARFCRRRRQPRDSARRVYSAA
jgi:probable HAF family extracellular repeat protein